MIAGGTTGAGLLFARGGHYSGTLLRKASQWRALHAHPWALFEQLWVIRTGEQPMAQVIGAAQNISEYAKGHHHLAQVILPAAV
jgi:ABC-type tungstate transport system permease subunit